MELLTDYMFQLAETPIPGYGGTFDRKYGRGPFKDSQEIMIQIWDYMRNTNLNDPLLNESYHYNRKQPYGQGPPENRSNIGRGQIAGSCLCGGTGPHNTVWWQTLSPYGKGHGRVYTLSEVAMVFYCRAINPANGAPMGDKGDSLDAGKKLIEVGLLLETFSVTHGFRSIQPNSRIRVAAGSEGGNINTAATAYPKYQIITSTGEVNNFPALLGRNGPSVIARWDNEDNYKGKRGWGAHGGVRLFSCDVESLAGVDQFDNPGVNQEQTQSNVLVFGTRFIKGSSQETVDPQNSIVINEADAFMDFQGSPQPLALVLYDDGRAGSASTGNLIQVFHVAFENPDDPSAKIRLPVPNLSKDSRRHTWAKRIKASGKDPSILIDVENDVTRSVMVAHGDFRLISGRRATNKHMWTPHPDFATSKRHAHTLTEADGTKLPGFNSGRGYALDKGGSPITYPEEFAPDFAGDPKTDRFFPKVTKEAKNYELSVDPGITGDWDNGIGPHIDGAYINRPDDGTSYAGPSKGSGDPYFENLEKEDVVHRTWFAPNRVVSGAGQLGSIPTGIQAEIPWRTLLFRPDAEHFGARDFPRVGDPPDHVMMDFFWMPSVEPFPISQPFATMGKVNMNYRIVPFDYINRATAMHAVMKDQRMLAIENGAASSYKKQGGIGSFRYPIDISATLLQFEDRFNKGEMFRSATEICEIYMIPRVSGAPRDRNTLGSPQRATKGARGWDYPTMREFWKSYALTGDNSKERTYANLYPRLTTKSNVFQTHMIVEAIQKVRSVAHDVFDPERDKVTGRWRGSAVIERNIDPGKIKTGPDSVPDYFTDVRFSRHPSMEEFYNYRVLNVKEFNP
jgi:uncharacterized protein (TIGR02600 family)